MELELWQVVVLAIVQGITEFLPVSSSGHLVVVAAVMAPGGHSDALEVPELVIFLHGGTLLSILVFYWRRIWELLVTDRRLIGLLAAATVPAVAVGFPAKLFANELLGSPLLAGVFLIVTGLVLIASHWSAPRGVDYRELRYWQSCLIGLAQAAAIMPGLSRSGSTITAGMWLGLSPASAATFSFLMAIPVIGGACLLESVSVWKAGGLSVPVGHLVTGVSVSFVAGLVALWWLVRWLERGRFMLFAAWCIPLGIGVVAWQQFFQR